MLVFDRKINPLKFVFLLNQYSLFKNAIFMDTLKFFNKKCEQTANTSCDLKNKFWVALYYIKESKMLFDIIFYILILHFSIMLKLRLMLVFVSVASTFQKHDCIFWEMQKAACLKLCTIVILVYKFWTFNPNVF